MRYILCLLLCVVMCVGCSSHRGETLILTANTEYLPMTEEIGRTIQHRLLQTELVVNGNFGDEELLFRNDLTDCLITSRPDIRSLPSLQLGTEHIVVITNPSSGLDRLELERFRRIMSGTEQNVQVITRETASPLRQLLSHTYGIDKIALNSLTVNSNAEMRNAVSSIPRAIGYIPDGNLSSSVKVVQIYHADGHLVSSPGTVVHIYCKDAKHLQLFADPQVRQIGSSYGLRSDQQHRTNTD